MKPVRRPARARARVIATKRRALHMHTRTTRLRATHLVVLVFAGSSRGRSKPPPVFHKRKGASYDGGSNATDIVIPRCKHNIASPTNRNLLREPACKRKDLARTDLCSMLASAPPALPNGSIPATARLYATRHIALSSVATPGMRIVEVGTLSGQLARFMIRILKPSRLIVMDLNRGLIRECKNTNINYAQQQGNDTEVDCQAGASYDLLAKLPGNWADIIYIDADHEYTSVCKDLEAARTKLRVGGLMVMNDFYLFETEFLADRGRWGVYGIIHAAYEFLNRHSDEWEVAYYALGTTNHGDFAIRRLK